MYCKKVTVRRLNRYIKRTSQRFAVRQSALEVLFALFTGKVDVKMQMQEKTMVADTLTGINGELVRFGEMIPQTENKELKMTLKQFRNACCFTCASLAHSAYSFILQCVTS